MRLWQTAALAATLACALAAAALGQTTATAPAAPAVAPTLDAASIKPSPPPSGNRIMVGIRTDPGRITAQNMDLKSLIVAAYGLKPYQVVGPDWLSSERFDIQAETTASVPRDQMLPLLRPYLEQQFKITSHRVTKTMPIYALVVASGGSKLKPASEAGAPLPPSLSHTMMAGPDGKPPAGGFFIMVSPKGMRMQGQATMDSLATAVGRMVDRPVLDMTGLQGRYDIGLDFAPTGQGMIMLNGAGPRMTMGGGEGGRADEAAAPAPSLFTALQDELGLKLDARKGPVEIMVIDHIEKVPVGN